MRMNFFVPDAIDLNELIHFITMIGVIAKRVEDVARPTCDAIHD
jgi:hypothetical protein